MSMQPEIHCQAKQKPALGQRYFSVIPDFSVLSPYEPGREMAERYIAEKFNDTYGATLSEFMPELLVMHQGAFVNGRPDLISAALGMRRGTDAQPLFLEAYLDVPAEQTLASAIGKPVSRASLVEIGNLVSTLRGSSQMLFVALTLLLCEQSVEWAIFTATPEVQKLLKRLHLEQILLGEADGRRLGAEQAQWGKYYDTHPSVIAISTQGARRALLRHPLSALMAASCEENISRLCRFEA